MPLYISSDHGGFDLKSYLCDFFINIIDIGPYSDSKSDYVDYAYKLCNEMDPFSDFGILICKTGIGMSIAANRNKNIRAALCTNVNMAELARKHNNANVLCLGASIVNFELAKDIVQKFINTEFSYEKRHIDRINKL